MSETYEHLSPILPENDGIPEDDAAEPDDADVDHAGKVEPEEDEQE